MHYHLIGICGTAMASLAAMLKERGHRVTGSDENVYPPMSTMLDALHIPVMQGYEAEHLAAAPDCVVVGNALSRGNPEVEETLNRRLTYRSAAEVIKEEFIRGRRSLVVAGTHGKTTTTSIAAWVLERGGLNPSFLVGGIVQNFGASARVTDSPYFVIEGDEYDTAYFDKGPKFMHYLPELAIVGNIEFDHADIYKDLDAVKTAFRRLMNLVPGGGRLIAGWDSPSVREVVAGMGAALHTRVETFGLSGDARWQARDVDYTSGALTRFRVFREGREWGAFETPLIGDFNVRNCLAAIVAGEAWGVSREGVAEALATFQSVKRRMQVRGTSGGVTVIDDFAHHPTAVRETLQALRAKYTEGRLVAVFEPRSATSRLAVFQDEYRDAFERADYVVISTVFHRERGSSYGQLLDTDALVRDIAARGTPAHCLDGADPIVTHLAPHLRPGDTVAVMSNGGFGGIHEKLLAALADSGQPAAVSGRQETGSTDGKR
ncbi:MAG TPA: UDP-N-acetylmuramate:L-alanyl-gamma-D-glutamyl-meso-diaminopimelate ligase [Pyrinomonadaceae bacterium]|nr:UDP-N-acetylmuramate:L-alanyl-gamma-D-glutamyl-meso-diaminopimelate ligase [Pyrinomonadaceae bacterium]